MTPSKALEISEEPEMADLGLFLFLTVLFALSLGFIRLFEALKER